MKKLADCGNSQTNTEPAQEETQSQSTESTGEETPSQSAESTDDDTQTQADTAQDHETEDSAKVKVAKDGADMQTEDKTMPTRKPMEKNRIAVNIKAMRIGLLFLFITSL